MKRFIGLVGILVATASMPVLVCSKPLDLEAYSLLEMVKNISGSGQRRTLSEAEVVSVISASQRNSIDVRMAAAYALGFSNSPAATKTLETLLSDKSPKVAGVAEFSVLRKEWGGKKRDELLALLSFKLGSSERPWTRVLLVVWLGDEFKADVIPLFFTALEKEKDPPVRTELLFQIALYGTRSQLEQLQRILAQEPPEVAQGIDETTATFLNMVSANPTKREHEIPLQFFLRTLIESRRKGTHSASQK